MSPRRVSVFAALVSCGSGDPAAVDLATSGFVARFDPVAAHIVDETTGATVLVSLRSWGRDGRHQPMEESIPRREACAAEEACTWRIRSDRVAITEWWEDRPEGLEHGFTVSARPPGSGMLVVDVEIGDRRTVVRSGDDTAILVSEDGAAPLYYARLAAWDEAGRALPAWMEPSERGVQLVVDDAHAVGTVTIDPVLTSVWTLDSNQTSAWLGYSVSSAGDVNADGYADVIVGAPLYDGGTFDEGRAYVYEGSFTGLGTVSDWTEESNANSANFGWSVAAAGDVNGDGFGDVVVGAPHFDNGSFDEGMVSVYHGSATGLGSAPAWTSAQTLAGANFGSSVSSAGDVNGDGFDDVIVGAYLYEKGGQFDEGGAFVFHGSATGLEDLAAWTDDPNLFSSFFGWSVSTAGDVNGDGYADVIVGAWLYEDSQNDEGGAFVYHGSVTGLDDQEDWSNGADQYSAYFGESVSSAGDVNGDGFGDIIVGARGYDSNNFDEGRAHVYLGSPAGLDTSAVWTVDGGQFGDNLGEAVSSAGDWNGDGYDDVVVSAPFHTNGTTDEGVAAIYLGSATGPSPSASSIAESNQVFPYFGFALAAAGDVNGDGLGDVIIGAQYFDDGETDEGRAFVYHGQCVDIVDTDLDTIGDACDDCAGSDDRIDGDFDGAPDGCDVCPAVSDPEQLDEDADGVGDACDPCAIGAPDADGDGVCVYQDCDESDPTVYLGAPELCDGKDNACAGFVALDENDLDGDGARLCGGECDDADPLQYPGAVEACNGLDDDCDGAIPENEVDGDFDGVPLCGNDCDDADSARSPSRIEECGDGIDNNCDDEIDERALCDLAGCTCDATGGLGGLTFLLPALVAATVARRDRRGSRATRSK